MLVATLSLLIGMLLGGSNIPTFIVEDLPKEIKRNIDDKERKDEILSILKEYEKEFKKSQKSLDKLKKKVKKLNLDRNSEKDSIDKVLNDASGIWQSIQTSGINNRILVQELLSEEEWENIIAKSIDELDKKEIKNQKKQYEKFNKEYDKVKNTIAEQITDVERRKKIDEAFIELKNLMKDYLEANKIKTLRYNDAFQNLNASKADLTEALSFLDESRIKLFDGIVKLHFELTEITTDEEWSKIAKSVNKLF